MVARLAVRRGPLRTEFTTRNRLDPGRSVHMQLVEGPFRVLEGHWSFTPVASNGCRIDFSLRFQFSNALKSALFEPLFEETAAALVRAFVARAQSTAGLRSGRRMPKRLPSAALLRYSGRRSACASSNCRMTPRSPWCSERGAAACWASGGRLGAAPPPVSTARIHPREHVPADGDRDRAVSRRSRSIRAQPPGRARGAALAARDARAAGAR